MVFPFQDAITLEDGRARLEPLHRKHFDALLPHVVGNPLLLQYSPSPFGTAEALQAYLAKAQDELAMRSRYAFAVYDKLRQSYAGSTSFGHISEKNDRLEIGWTWLAPEFQRTGLNRHIKFLMLHFAFETLSCERVEFRTDSRNLASRKAIRSIGASFEGLMRRHTLMTDGHRRDTVCFSILSTEWPDIRQKRFLGLPASQAVPSFKR